MIVRNVDLPGRSIDFVTDRCLRRITSRDCEIRPMAEHNVYEFAGLMGSSSLVAASGKIAFHENDGYVSVRIGVSILPSMGGAILLVLSILVAVFTLGLSLMLYFLIRDNATASVCMELDRLAMEIERIANLPE